MMYKRKKQDIRWIKKRDDNENEENLIVIRTVLFLATLEKLKIYEWNKKCEI